jgi:hypothetical protein
LPSKLLPHNLASARSATAAKSLIPFVGLIPFATFVCFKGIAIHCGLHAYFEHGALICGCLEMSAQGASIAPTIIRLSKALTTRTPAVIVIIVAVGLLLTSKARWSAKDGDSE